MKCHICRKEKEDLKDGVCSECWRELDFYGSD